jgi:hypothetical protein
LPTVTCPFCVRSQKLLKLFVELPIWKEKKKKEKALWFHNAPIKDALIKNTMNVGTDMLTASSDSTVNLTYRLPFL